MLIATAIMTVGLVMIATIFPVAVKLTGLSTQRSVAAVVADEAFAKIKLYGLRDFVNWPSAQIDAAKSTPVYSDPVDATYNFCDLFKYTTNVEVFEGGDGIWETEDDWYISPGLNGLYESSSAGLGGDDVAIDLGSEFLYPSAVVAADESQKYHWSALCRRTDLKDVQVTVFVTHKTFSGMNYYAYPYNSPPPEYVPADTAIWPVPVKVNITVHDSRTLVIDTAGSWGTTALSFIDEGCTIVDDYRGKIYRVLEITDRTGDDISDIILWDDWEVSAGKPAGVPDAVLLTAPQIESRVSPCDTLEEPFTRLVAVRGGIRAEPPALDEFQ